MMNATGPQPVNPELLTVRELARLLGCSPRHVHRLRDCGAMPPPVKLGALLRWSRAAVAQWIADGCPPVRRPGR